MWTEYFKMVKVHRGRIVTQSHGEIDFSRNDIPLETCKELYDQLFPYIELTELGRNELYGIGEKSTDLIYEPKQKKGKSDKKSKE